MKAKRGIAFLASSFTRSSRCNRRHMPPVIAAGRRKASTTSTRAADGDSERTPAGGVAGEETSRRPRAMGHVLLRSHLERLRKSPTESLLLDGGTGEELFLRGVPDDRKTWSAAAVVHEKYHPIVEEVHRAYIGAGSQAITTNSYGIVPGVGFTDGEEVKRLTSLSGAIARKAVTRETSPHPAAIVLGSLGPQVASYRPDLIMKHKDGLRAFRHPIEGLYPHVDAYIAETMSCLEEACQAVDALSKFNDGLTGEAVKHPILVSFTLNDEGKIRSGEAVVEVIPKLVDYAFHKGVELIGVLFNCCEPESVSKALKEIQSDLEVQQCMQHPPHEISMTQISKDRPSKIFLGAYAHRLTPIDPQWTMESSDEAQDMRGDLSPEQYWEDFVKIWHGSAGKKSRVDSCCETKAGSTGDNSAVSEIGSVQLIGGCCGIGPDHISVLRSNLAQE